ncbi:Zinc finger MYM-type protein 1-like [Oopsacas minuta]|uniref:Zinc finger MYM-type protein 1-like n=1 Tax=Oopsacas minuta TaxID=111878 RepID=A0AAV7JEC6_9METZ|nr:Zinc finger MYM-type protein 1-like [Oopsacas minuta]
MRWWLYRRITSKCTKVTKIDYYLNDSTFPAVLARMTACDGLLINIFTTSKGLRKFLMCLGHSLSRSVTTIREQVFKSEQIKREWLLYSPSTGLIFCFACKLFDDVKSQFSNGGFVTGAASSCITQHENSSGHRNSMFVLISRRKLSGRINTSLEIQLQIEREYWHSVLKRIVSTVEFLSTRGLALRGQNEQINSEQNGNYLGILGLISEFDPFLSNHLAKYSNIGKGRASYLSSTICEEVIQIMGEKLLLIITSEVKDAKYFPLSVDSIPDFRHVDQLTITLRYIEKSSHQVTERFLKFLPIESHTGENLANTVLQFLKKQGIYVGGIRGQSYDNASNMSGRYKGMQARIREVIYNAVYIPVPQIHSTH